MQIVIDLDTRKPQRSLTDSRTATQFDFKRGDDAVLEILFVRAGVQTQLTVGIALTFGVKLRGRYDSTPLVQTNDFTLSGSGAVAKYIGYPSFNTAELNEAFGIDDSETNDVAVLDLMGEISWTEPTTEILTSSETFSVRVNNDVNREDDAPPNALPSPSDWLDARAVRFDKSQTLTDAQKQIARGNTDSMPEPIIRDTAPVDSTMRLSGDLTDGTYSTASIDFVFETYSGGRPLYSAGDATAISWNVSENAWFIIIEGIAWYSTADVATPDLVPTGVWHATTNPHGWKPLSPATGTPVVAEVGTAAQAVGQLVRVGTAAPYTWHRVQTLSPNTFAPTTPTIAEITGLTDALAAKQPLDSDLTAYANAADAAARRTLLALAPDTTGNANLNAILAAGPAASRDAVEVYSKSEISKQAPILENIEGLNRAFDDFMRMDNDSESLPHRLSFTGFADSMPGNPSSWVAMELAQRYGVGMLFTPNLGQSWNGATESVVLAGGAAVVTDFSRMPNGIEFNIPIGGSYYLPGIDIGSNLSSMVYLPSGNLAEARVNSENNTVPLINGIQKVRVFYVKLPSAGSITATVSQPQFSDVTATEDADAAEALGYIDLTPKDFYSPVNLTVSATTSAVRFLGAAYMSGSGVAYWSSAKGSTKMDDQVPGLRSGNWNQVYKDLCTALNTSFVLHCQRASDAGTEANNYVENYQTFFDAYREHGLGQVVFEEPHRDVENALTTATINSMLRNLCAAESIAFFRSQRIVLSGSTTALGWGDGDNIHRDSREWRYVAGVFLSQVGYFRSAFSRYGEGISLRQLAEERFKLDSIARARQTLLLGRGGVYSSTTWTGSSYANPSVLADTGFNFVTVTAQIGHSAAVFGNMLGGSSQLETSVGNLTIGGNGYRSMSLPSGGGQRACLIFGHNSTQVTNVENVTMRSFGIEFANGTDIGGGLANTEYARIWAHNGTSVIYGKWFTANTSGGPSGNGISFILQWRKELGGLICWMNGHNSKIFPRASLLVPELKTNNTAGSFAHGYIRATGTGHTAGKMQWLQLTSEFGALNSPYSF